MNAPSTLPVALQAAMRSPVGPVQNALWYTPVFRVAFPHLDEPWAGENKSGKAEPAFSCLGVFADDADLSYLTREAARLLASKHGPQFQVLVNASKLRWPLMPKAAMAIKYAGFEGDGFYASFRANQSAPPACVDRTGDRSLVLQRGAIERSIYAGSFCYAVVSIYYYSKGGGQGVGTGLRTLVKVADGERFGGAQPPSEAEVAAAVSGVQLPGLVAAGGGLVIEGRAEPVVRPSAPTPSEPLNAPWNPTPAPNPVPSQGFGSQSLMDDLG